MKVPDTVLPRLLCDNCDGYLSRGPVFMLDTGTNRCGRCTAPKVGARRNRAYEELATLVTFPCRYVEEGCRAQVTFEKNQEHENACEFRPFVCPIAPSGQCDWSGIRGNLLQHCQTAHPNNVIQNPHKLTHDITRSSLYNYLMYAFNVLFLVQTKVCITSRKIYHSVRLFGDRTAVSKYHFTVDIENNGVKLIKPGSVAPQGCLALQEDTSLASGINGLLEVLGDFKDTVFTLTVRSTVDQQETENPSRATSSAVTLVNCTKCKVSIEPTYRDSSKHGLCAVCSRDLRSCRFRNKGCLYTNISSKISKHEEYFCHFNKCFLCNSNFTSSCDEHYIQYHSDITVQVGTYSVFTPLWSTQFKIIKTDFGNVVCRCIMDCSTLKLSIYTPLPIEQLTWYNCVLYVSGVMRKEYMLNVDYNREEDYYVEMPYNEFYGVSLVLNTKFSGNITFTKIENPPVY